MTIKHQERLKDIQTIKSQFESLNYICSEEIATAVYLAYHLEKPVLIEGPPGVGKTELAKTTADMLGLTCIRLQCYEGLDESKAIYEWKYGKQLLYTQVLKETLGEVLQGAKGLSESVKKLQSFGDIFFSEEFLEPRPLLKALKEKDSCVLLIDEVDKSDHEFESLLLERLRTKKECVFCADKNEYLLRVVKDVRCSLLRSMYYIKIHTHLTLSLVFLSHFFCIYSNCAKLSFVFSYTSSGVAIASTFLTFPKVS